MGTDGSRRVAFTVNGLFPSPHSGFLVFLRFAILLAALHLWSAPAFTQSAPPTPPVSADSVTELRLVDGTVVRGQVIERTDAVIVLRTASGVRVEVPRSQVAQERMVAVRPSGEVWDEDPNLTRLFFTSTARPLARGEGYVSSYFLFFPFVAYGVTDRITIAGGTPIIPGLLGELFYVAPKVTVVNRERFAFALGALGFFAPEVLDEGSIGIVYGAATVGRPDAAVTLGAGWGYAATDVGSGFSNQPVFVLGGERRISRRVKLITENWFGVNDGLSGLASAGVRFIGDRLSADLGLGGAIGAEDFGCCVPLVNFVWTFGRTRR